jgi:hypothetical protein
LGKREEALAILRAIPERVMPDVQRNRDLADLRNDSRFQEWVHARQSNKESLK